MPVSQRSRRRALLLWHRGGAGSPAFAPLLYLGIALSCFAFDVSLMLVPLTDDCGWSVLGASSERPAAPISIPGTIVPLGIRKAQRSPCRNALERQIRVISGSGTVAVTRAEVQVGFEMSGFVFLDFPCPEGVAVGAGWESLPANPLCSKDDLTGLWVRC